MDAAERDSTADWVLPAEATPPLLSDLERKIDEALALARSSEAAVVEIGALALDAAERAGRAAELAARAASVASGGEGEVVARPAVNGTAGSTASSEAVAYASPAAEEALRRFTERADRVAARLRAV